MHRATHVAASSCARRCPSETSAHVREPLRQNGGAGNGDHDDQKSPRSGGGRGGDSLADRAGGGVDDIFVGIENPATASIANFAQAVPFGVSNTYDGGSAGLTLDTAHAQANAGDPTTGSAGAFGATETTLDLTGLGGTAVTLKFSIKVGGIDGQYGNALAESGWRLGYITSGGQFVGLYGRRDSSATGVLQEVDVLDAGGGATKYSSNFYGNFNYSLTIDPFTSPRPIIYTEASCDVSELPASGGYCSLGLGFGLPPVQKKRGFAAFSASTAAGVPEPASWALLAAGFGAVGLATRRRPRMLAA